MTAEAVELLEIPLAINLAAVGFGALSGVIRAGEDEHTDLMGVFSLAAVMGFGGGLVRDILLGNLPPAAFRDPLYVVTVLGATVIGGLFLVYLKKLGKVLWVLDSLTVGLFACVGANAALLAGLEVLPAVMIGMLASIGGLILADLLQGRPSSIMYVGPPNAVAGLAGALVYAVMYTGDHQLLTTVVAVVVTFLVRLAGPVLHWQVPQPRKRAYELELKLRRKAQARRKHRRPPQL